MKSRNQKLPISIVHFLVLDFQALRTNLESVHFINRYFRLVGMVVAHKPCIHRDQSGEEGGMHQKKQRNYSISETKIRVKIRGDKKKKKSSL